MPALFNKTTAAKTLDRLLHARDNERTRSLLRKTWGASLRALTLSGPAVGHTARDRAAAVELAGRIANLTLRLAQAEAARDCLRTSSQRHAAGQREGLWEIHLGPGHLTDPASRFWWSPEFRTLLGFDTAEEFPDVFDSWRTRVHVDDLLPTLAAFGAHLHDRSGRTPFDVCYRLRCKDGEYRWFRARGQARRSAEGVPVTALGVLLELPPAA